MEDATEEEKEQKKKRRTGGRRERDGATERRSSGDHMGRRERDGATERRSSGDHMRSSKVNERRFSGDKGANPTRNDGLEKRHSEKRSMPNRTKSSFGKLERRPSQPEKRTYDAKAPRERRLSGRTISGEKRMEKGSLSGERRNSNNGTSKEKRSGSSKSDRLHRTASSGPGRCSKSRNRNISKSPGHSDGTKARGRKKTDSVVKDKEITTDSTEVSPGPKRSTTADSTEATSDATKAARGRKKADLVVKDKEITVDFSEVSGPKRSTTADSTEAPGDATKARGRKKAELVVKDKEITADSTEVSSPKRSTTADSTEALSDGTKARGRKKADLVVKDKEITADSTEVSPGPKRSTTADSTEAPSDGTKARGRKKADLVVKDKENTADSTEVSGPKRSSSVGRKRAAKSRSRSPVRPPDSSRCRSPRKADNPQKKNETGEAKSRLPRVVNARPLPNVSLSDEVSLGDFVNLPKESTKRPPKTAVLPSPSCYQESVQSLGDFVQFHAKYHEQLRLGLIEPDSQVLYKPKETTSSVPDSSQAANREGAKGKIGEGVQKEKSVFTREAMGGQKSKLRYSIFVDTGGGHTKEPMVLVKGRELRDDEASTDEELEDDDDMSEESEGDEIALQQVQRARQMDQSFSEMPHLKDFQCIEIESQNQIKEKETTREKPSKHSRSHHKRAGNEEHSDYEEDLEAEEQVQTRQPSEKRKAVRRLSKQRHGANGRHSDHQRAQRHETTADFDGNEAEDAFGDDFAMTMSNRTKEKKSTALRRPSGAVGSQLHFESAPAEGSGPDSTQEEYDVFNTDKFPSFPTKTPTNKSTTLLRRPSGDPTKTTMGDGTSDLRRPSMGNYAGASSSSEQGNRLSRAPGSQSPTRPTLAETMAKSPKALTESHSTFSSGNTDSVEEGPAKPFMQFDLTDIGKTSMLTNEEVEKIELPEKLPSGIEGLPELEDMDETEDEDAKEKPSIADGVKIFNDFMTRATDNLVPLFGTTNDGNAPPTVPPDTSFDEGFDEASITLSSIPQLHSEHTGVMHHLKGLTDFVPTLPTIPNMNVSMNISAMNISSMKIPTMKWKHKKDDADGEDVAADRIALKRVSESAPSSVEFTLNEPSTAPSSMEFMINEPSTTFEVQEPHFDEAKNAAVPATPSTTSQEQRMARMRQRIRKTPARRKEGIGGSSSARLAKSLSSDGAGMERRMFPKSESSRKARGAAKKELQRSLSNVSPEAKLYQDSLSKSANDRSSNDKVSKRELLARAKSGEGMAAMRRGGLAASPRPAKSNEDSKKKAAIRRSKSSGDREVARALARSRGGDSGSDRRIVPRGKGLEKD